MRRCLAPVGQGALRGCVFDAVCPCGAKALLSGAPDHGVSRKEAGFRNVSPIKGLSRRAGGRGNGLLPARSGVFPARRHPYALTMSLSPKETEIRAISQSERALPHTKPSTFIHPWQTRPFTSRASSLPRFAANIRRTSNTSFPRLFQPFRSRKKVNFPLPVTASFPNPSRRENGGLCPHPPTGPVPWVSLFGERLSSSPLPPSPKTPQAASPCAWACRRLRARPPQAERNAAYLPPARGEDMRQYRAEGAGRRHCRPAPCSWGGCASTRRRRLWLPTLSAPAWASAWPR